MSLVVDASVAVKWVVDEPGRSLARQIILRRGDGLIAPEFLLIEVANVLRSKSLKGELEPSACAPALEFVRSAMDRFVADSSLASRALEPSFHLGHPVYDCVYLACALQEDADMVTADEKLLKKLRRDDQWRRVLSLGDFPRILSDG